MKNQKYVAVFITAPNGKEAKRIAENLVDRKLAACVNIVPRIESIYRWKGKIERSGELLLIAKTRSALTRKLIAEVKNAHSYTVPEIICLPIVKGNREYLDWISESTL